jgi:hypothetical protein
MKKLFKVPVRFLWILVSIIILQACYPGDSIPISDLDTTTTLYNSDDLATAPTSAAIVWEVVQIKSDDGDDLDYDGGADDEILNTTLDELVKLYGATNVYIISETATPAPAPSNTSVAVVVPNVDPLPSAETVYAPSVVLRNKTIVYTYPGYPWWGGGGWGGWYPGYPGGCYYCGYPSYGSTTYQVGTVLLEMYDARKIPAGGPVPADFDMSWIGIMRGILGSNSASNSARVISGIQQAFEQSPYLK